MVFNIPFVSLNWVIELYSHAHVRKSNVFILVLVLTLRPNHLAHPKALSLTLGAIIWNSFLGMLFISREIQHNLGPASNNRILSLIIRVVKGPKDSLVVDGDLIKWIDWGFTLIPLIFTSTKCPILCRSGQWFIMANCC
jgi:hypothetical protein